jgi:hypothetical protein
MDNDGFAQLGPDPAAMALKQELSEIILWNEQSSPRSLQKSLGPSELGDPCDRRIAYKIAGIPAVNIWADPWPAIVGTAIHDWLEKAINRYQDQVGDRGWLTELGVSPDPMVQGHSDIFNTWTKTVVDHKTTGTDKIRKLRKGESPSAGYIAQVHLYGLGHERAGREVRNVALIFYPRSGWLDDAFVWHEPYNREIALDSLERMYRIGFRLMDLEIETHPYRFEDIQATPGDNCVWCPLFNRELDFDIAASDKGCPGKQTRRQ